MSATLRERRRLQTAREIQSATLRLAHTYGLDLVTTEMIAKQAGISPRTFFNYYPNKEAALIGDPPGIPPQAVEAFVASKGPLADDLRILLGRHLATVESDREIPRGILALAESNSQVRELLQNSLQKLHDEMRTVCRRRLPDAHPVTLHFLTQLVLGAGRMAIDSWISGNEPTIEPTVNEVWSHLIQTCELLAHDLPSKSADSSPHLRSGP